MVVLSAAIIVFAYLSIVVPAVPVALPRRGFSLKQRSKPNIRGRTINLPGIYASSFTKFGAAVPQGIKAAADNGSAVAKPEANDKEYLTPVKVGGTTLNLGIDTGSADLWVFSQELPVAERSGHSIYKPTANSTKMDGYTWKISYGDGSGASGDVYKDTVSVGGVTSHRQAIEAAKDISKQFTLDKNNDGLMGLAFSSLNTVQPRSQTTFFDTVKSDLDSPLFAVSLKHHAAGSYDFGYIDKSKHTGSIKYTDVDSSDGFWMFTAEGYGIGDGKPNSKPVRGIVDTGTTLTLLPDDIVKEYYQQVPDAQQSPIAGGYVFPCSTDLPDFTTVIGGDSSSSNGSGNTGGFSNGNGSIGIGGGFGDLSHRSRGNSGSYKAVTPGKHIKMSSVDEDGTICFGGIQSNSGMEFSIFGDVFLKNQYVVFDSEGPKLGFAQQADP